MLRLSASNDQRADREGFEHLLKLCALEGVGLVLPNDWFAGARRDGLVDVPAGPAFLELVAGAAAVLDIDDWYAPDRAASTSARAFSKSVAASNTGGTAGSSKTAVWRSITRSATRQFTPYLLNRVATA